MKGDVLKCAKCGSDFVAKSAKHKYCSSFCRNEIVLEKKEELERAQYLIFERDEFKCCYCGSSPIEDNVRLIVEHVIPRCIGGTNGLYNVVTACSECNEKKLASRLSPDIIRRILRRNIKKNRGISSNKRNEMKRLLNLRFPIDSNLNAVQLFWGAK